MNSLQVVFYPLRPTYEDHGASEELHPSEPQINSHLPGWRDSEGWQCPKPLLLIGKSAGCELEQSSNSSNAKTAILENQPSRTPTVLPSPWRPRHRARSGWKSETPTVCLWEKVGGVTWLQVRNEGEASGLLRGQGSTNQMACWVSTRV